MSTKKGSTGDWVAMIFIAVAVLYFISEAKS